MEYGDDYQDSDEIDPDGGWYWSDGSALWQVEYGEVGSEKWDSAVTHLEVSLNAGDGDTCFAIGLSLLSAVERLRYQEIQRMRAT